MWGGWGAAVATACSSFCSSTAAPAAISMDGARVACATGRGAASSRTAADTPPTRLLAGRRGAEGIWRAEDGAHRASRGAARLKGFAAPLHVGRRLLSCASKEVAGAGDIRVTAPAEAATAASALPVTPPSPPAGKPPIDTSLSVSVAGVIPVALSGCRVSDGVMVVVVDEGKGMW